MSANKAEWVLGVLGGSGLYQMDALEDREELAIDTPWGAPSDKLVAGRIGATRVIFLPRHGRAHSIPPSQLNFRANIAALKLAGCTDILSVSACGSLREHLPPGTFIAVDQFIDRTFARESSFFGEGCVAHVSMAHPVCERLAGLAIAAGQRAGIDVVQGGTYLAMEGPQFSTKAESLLYRSWGCNVIGMTNMPEAKLAREAELPYATLAMVTDYDCWHEEEGPVDVAAVVKCLHENAHKARALVKELALGLTAPRASSPIDTALDLAIITPPEARDPALLHKLAAISPRLFGG